METLERRALLATLYAYGPGQGTLPEEQGFTRLDNFGTEPEPVVGGGVLHQFSSGAGPSGGAQYWFRNSVSLDFSTTAYALEADLLVHSSNYDLVSTFPNQRSGYYLQAIDSVGHIFAVGISSGGITINTDSGFGPTNGVPFTPFDTTNGFHTYRLVIDSGAGSLFIDGSLFASTAIGGAVRPDVANRVVFGDASGAGASETELREFTFSNSDAAAEVTADAGGPYSVSEGSSVLLTGSGSDSQGNPISFAWDLDNNGSFETSGQNVNFSAVGRDGPDAQAVVLRVTNSNGDFATDSVVVDITNADPTATDNTYTTTQGSSVFGNVIVDDTGAGSDSDPAGASDPLVVASYTNPASGSLTLNTDGSFTYTPESTFSGSVSFTYSIDDGDGGSASAAVTIIVASAPAGSILTVADTCLGGTALLVTGTSEGDTIVIEPGTTSATLTLTYNGTASTVPKPSGRIIVTGGAGNDDIQIAGAITNPSWLYGDQGDDRLNAGSGGSLQIGGDGNDQLLGGNGRDVMIGGQGADKLVGNPGSDILVAGLTTKDERSNPDHEEFWCHVLQEWNGASSFSTRVNNLRGNNSSYTGPTLLPEVVDDTYADEIDFLNGAAGEDWLIFLAGEDKVVGTTEAAN